MKIRLNDGSRKRPIVIPLPLWLIANPISSLIISCNTEITYSQLQKLMKALRKSKRVLKRTPLAEVHSADGEEVTVWL